MKWIPEPKPPTGGLAAEGFYKLLGRPRLDPLTVLVRETAQNSWDARLNDLVPVSFTIQGWELSEDEQYALKNQIFVEAHNVVGIELAAELSRPSMLGLYITDRNTKGLGGPLQADRVDPNEVYDWVDFALNVGEANTQGLTGGTYGFGKTISYVVSAANSIVVHSRAAYDDTVQTRLMASAIGMSFTRHGTRFTGRHWWGEAGESVPIPVTGTKADKLATAIGMPEFEDNETGTNILIVAPDTGGRTPEQAMRFLAESVTWHLWPKLMPRASKVAPMEVHVMWNGEPVHIPRPEERPPLHGFAQAFQAILDGTYGEDLPGLKIDPIRSQRPKEDIGTLSTVPLVHRDRATVDDGHGSDDPDSPASAAMISGVCHHVALLRAPELVVDYLEGPAPPEGGTEWAGVFRAHDNQDQYFALAEPPTHDSWNPELLPKGLGRTIVNVGLREIKSSLENRWATGTRSPAAQVASTALIADELAGLIRSVDGRGAGKSDKASPTVPRGPVKPKIDLLHTGPIEAEPGLATEARFVITPALSSTATLLQIGVAVALDGGSADADLDPSLELAYATISGVRHPLSGRKKSVKLIHSSPAEIVLVVRRGPDTSVLFDLEAEAR